MSKATSVIFKKGSKAGFIFLLWMITAWLFYPLITLNAVEMVNAKTYLYRSAIGIAIMLILLGKTIFDLMFPQSISDARSIVNTVFLTLYCLAIAGSVIFMVSRMIILYIRSGDTVFPF
ncbi:hypothetical protein AMJ44_01320 [candidate division WOR-1 bacterium DG_54_3]|uniref:Uncharacterized protein n=1 Tax=candidate division WOR-1 bacterium DG_54_3 TaxID=1703775 RepID=A0A0S7Y5B6_UNCSA|nr:MAG: hypothetical protein AMJ44_01320 [candidate division WOR-1 bacterium DG_54_3]